MGEKVWTLQFIQQLKDKILTMFGGEGATSTVKLTQIGGHTPANPQDAVNKCFDLWEKTFEAAEGIKTPTHLPTIADLNSKPTEQKKTEVEAIEENAKIVIAAAAVAD